MYEFEYLKVTSVADAKAAHSANEDATYLAGGMTLIPTMKQRLASPSDVIDLKGTADLVGISEFGGGLEIKGPDNPRSCCIFFGGCHENSHPGRIGG